MDALEYIFRFLFSLITVIWIKSEKQFIDMYIV